MLVVMVLASGEIGRIGPDDAAGSAVCGGEDDLVKVEPVLPGDGDDPGDLPGEDLSSGRISTGEYVRRTSSSEAAAAACLCLRVIDRLAKNPLDRDE